MPKKTTAKKEPKQRAVKALPAPDGGPVPQISNAVDPQTLIMSAIQQGASIDMLERLLNLRDRIQKEQAVIAYREAMAALQAELPVIVKSTKVNYQSKSGGNVKYNYASIDQIFRATRDIISRHGFSYTFTTEQTPESVSVNCHIHHAAGHTETTAVTILIDQESKMNAAQAAGTAITYAKRYAFCNGFGIMTGEQDTDGNTPPQPDANAERIQAMRDKLNTLPDDIIEGLRNAEYKLPAAWQFCEDREWKHERIKADINKVVDQRNIK